MGTYLRADWAVKVIIIVVIGSVFFRSVSGVNITVGGSSGWDLTSDLHAWTAETPFHVGDSLVFSYAGAHDVVEVHEEDFESCNISHPIKTHNDGETVVPLSQQGTRYFVCGRHSHCLMGQKLQVHVLPPLTTHVDDGADTDSARNPDRRGGGGGGGGRGRRQPPPTPNSLNNGTSNQSPNRQDPDLPSLGPLPCLCSGVPDTVAEYYWLMPLVTTLVILISSLSPFDELGGLDLLGVFHLVI